MKRLLSITTAIVIIMAIAIPVFAEDPDPGTGSTNFTVMNLSDTTTANVQADYISAMPGLEGSIAASWATTITARSSAGFAAAAAGNPPVNLPDNWTGSVIVSSDQPVVAFAQMIWTNSTLPTTEGRYQTAGAYNGFTEGANKLFFPSLSQRPGAQDSVIAVQSAAANSTTDSVEFTVSFYDRDGTQTYVMTDTVNMGAQKTYVLTDLGDVFAATGGNGAAVVEATDPSDLLAASATMHWRNYSASYSAVTGGGTEISLPSATRRVPDGTNWFQYTGIVVQNLDPALDADAQVTWYDRLGNPLHVFTDTIPPSSSHGFNTRFVDTSNVPPSSWTTLPAALTDDWNGSVVIESVGAGAAELVAVANLQWAPAHPSSPNSASAYTSFAGGTETVFVPATFRRHDGAATPTWRQFTGLIVQNVGTAACNNFGVSWRDRDGNELVSYTDSLDPAIAHGYNTRQGSAGSDIPATVDIADLGTDFRGSVTITGGAGCELAAIHNTVWPIWTDSTTYNAFGQ